jgi:hypothetical protein
MRERGLRPFSFLFYIINKEETVMSVDDIVYKLFNPESYEFRINGITYGKQGDIPDNVLSKNVQYWEVKPSEIYDYSCCLDITTLDFISSVVISNIMNKGFSMDQINRMMKNGTSLSAITDMVLTIPAVVDTYTKMGYNKSRIRPIVYEAYANELFEDLNNFILGNQTKED